MYRTVDKMYNFNLDWIEIVENKIRDIIYIMSRLIVSKIKTRMYVQIEIFFILSIHVINSTEIFHKFPSKLRLEK